MMELLRAIISRLGNCRNRRADLDTGSRERDCPRVGLGEGGKASTNGRAAENAGYTRDISESGLALIVPAIRIGGQYLTTQDLTLEITLTLPSGSVKLQATPVRYSPLDNDENNVGHVIGVQITKMSEPDREHYNAYLEELTKKRKAGGEKRK